MRIESSPQAYQGYRKTTSQSASKSFQQVMQTAAQDRYVPGARSQPAQTEMEFSRAERTYYGCVTVSNATHAKLKQLAELDKQSDYTGMSPDEIYAEIWNRYNEAFDGNMVAITGCIAGPSEWNVVNNQFLDEIHQHIFNPEVKAAYKAAKGAQANTPEEERALYRSIQYDVGGMLHNAFLKVLGYDGMSFDEREAAIKEKYAGKNTTLDFLKMQSELKRTGVLKHKMGEEGARTYCTMIDIQFERNYNPNSFYQIENRSENVSNMTADQWYRVADQPFDAKRFATVMKEQLSHISSANGFPPDLVKSIEDCINQFVEKTAEDSIDQLLHETGK